MTNFRMMITNDGKHPADKWADLAVDDLMEISAQAPDALLREATIFRGRLHTLLTKHHQRAMDDEAEQIRAGRHAHDLPYETEHHAKSVVDEVVEAAKGTSFASHFHQDHVKQHVENVCNHFFKSAKLVERQHFHANHAETKKKR